MKRKTTILVDDRMAGIGTALISDHDIRLGRQHIGDLTFSFISPVRTYNCSYHKASSFIYVFAAGRTFMQPSHYSIIL